VILADTSVWIELLRNSSLPHGRYLRDLVIGGDVLTGDLIMAEVLQGARDEKAARNMRSVLLSVPVVQISSPDLAVQAAADYRHLRALGITVRSTIDMLIGAFCIANDYLLLHRDRDFDAMERHLGLRVLHA
jgi:predicted nucleic acid-binding protein